MNFLENAQRIDHETDFQEKVRAAVVEWKTVVGETYVDTSESTLFSYSRTCGKFKKLPVAVISPSSTEEIQQILRIANSYRVPVFSVSRGKNWGYGSAAPATDGNAIIELSRMSKIITVNSELGYAVVEPGVTQGMLAEYLTQTESNFLVDITGAPPTASVIGNVLERGFGLGLYSDHFLNVSGMEVVLPSGEVIGTGFCHYPNSKTSHIYKWGIGPYVDGLFSQSNLGIVTKMGVWLARKPDYTVAVLVKIENDENFGRFLTEWKNLKLTGTFPGQIRFANDLRILSCLCQYPFDRYPDGRLLSERDRGELRAKWDVAYWNGFGQLQGSYEQVKVQLRMFKRIFGSLSRVQIISEKLLASRDSFLQKLFVSPTKLSAKKVLLDLINGKPTIEPTLGVYWRKRRGFTKGDYDPLRDRCGIYWVAPIIPMSPSDLLETMKAVTTISEKYGFERNVGLIPVNDRACCCTVGVVYDQEIEEESNRAHSCYSELTETLYAMGYPPYRYGPDVEKSKGSLFRSDDSFWQFCNLLKKAIDPNMVLAPGRYGMGS